jgi:ribonucleotide monophosphatase NagD (HAD superfamily)
MVCTNPDLVMVTRTGGTAYMPGKIALRYRDHFRACNCGIFGKPNKEHFEACLRKLQVADRARVAHVGDSLSHHDIAGAINAGIPNIFVTSGVQASQLAGYGFWRNAIRRFLARTFSRGRMSYLSHYDIMTHSHFDT